jgi:hypothetical protein
MLCAIIFLCCLPRRTMHLLFFYFWKKKQKRWHGVWSGRQCTTFWYDHQYLRWLKSRVLNHLTQKKKNSIFFLFENTWKDYKDLNKLVNNLNSAFNFLGNILLSNNYIWIKPTWLKKKILVPLSIFFLSK